MLRYRKRRERAPRRPELSRLTGRAGRAVALGLLALLTLACDRNIEPYRNEPVEAPDLARIFPEGAGQPGVLPLTGADGSGALTMPPPPPGARGLPPAPSPARSDATGGAGGGSGSRSGRSTGGTGRASAPAAPPLTGTITLAPALRGKVKPGAVLFLIARSGAAGPPTAVLRIPSPVFPLDFELGPEHKMIAQLPFAGPFTLSARVDSDGDAISRTPGDLAGEAAGRHLPGARNIRLQIDQAL